MIQTCSRCSRVNPVGACYCYFDGAALMGASQAGANLPVGSQPFAQPFVFPSGKTCRNFDQLALACQEDWQTAASALGDLERFLGGLGRSDLATAAREAARGPDRERGVDDFLARLPGQAVQPPRLAVEPIELNLGLLAVGADRTFELHLRNQGMRLVHGSISVDDALWLAVGPGRGGAQKLFQFGADLTLQVRVRGKQLRASHKPLTARLVITSNAGDVVVNVRAELPVKAFAEGVLAGARSPRQIAERAKANPKEAARLFEQGLVARWYRDNGWAYPVQGAGASGLAAVQQFFEALGLTPAPKVDISARSLILRGQPGGKVNSTIEVRTGEKRPVWATAVSDQPWLEVGKPRLDGRVASIPLVVKKLPDAAGQTLRANLMVRANGNQRFVVPVTLDVAVVSGQEAGIRSQESAIRSQEAGMNLGSLPVSVGRVRTDRRHWLSGAALAASLGAVVGLDFLLPQGSTRPPAPTFNDPVDPFPNVGGEPRIGLTFKEMNQRFGIVILDKDDDRNREDRKRLTYAHDGSTNNTCVKIDGFENLFGQNPGEWVRDRRGEIKGRVQGPRHVSAWKYPQNVAVTQSVLIVPNHLTGQLDTCLVHYKLENRDARAHTVGLRFMLDTFIGGNDGVPFVLPGRDGLMDTKIDIQNSKDVPVYIQALEVADLASPGTIAQVGLKLPADARLDDNDPNLEEMTRLVISHFPGNPEIRWDFVAQSKFWDMNDRSKGHDNDSCVTMYWDYRPMAPGETRVLAFTYGLGRAGSGPRSGARLALTASSGAIRRGDRFTVTAWVQDGQPGQRVKLHLPEGMSFAAGAGAEQPVSQGRGRLGQASWEVLVASDAKLAPYRLLATSAGERDQFDVNVGSSYRGIFGK